MSNRVTYQKTIRARLYQKALLALVLTAMGVALHHFRPPWQHIEKLFGFINKKTQQTPTSRRAYSPPVLRGTIYDRNFLELAVSYQLFSLHAEPAKLTDLEKTAHRLANILGEAQESLLPKLRLSGQYVEIANNLDAEQAAAIQRMNIAGIYCEPFEIRYYPEHTTGAHVIGFTEHNLGLAGVEGLYDTILQPGEFTARDLPEMDFAGITTFGDSSADLKLSIDLELQKSLEDKLKMYMQEDMVEKAMALILDVQTGNILAMISLPTFNPNFFWQVAEENRNNNLLCTPLDLDLLQPLLLPAAEAAQDEFVAHAPLPATVAAPKRELTGEEMESFYQTIALRQKMLANLHACAESAADLALKKTTAAQNEFLPGLQLATTLASLLNGGWHLPLHFLESVHDRATHRYLQRATAYDKQARKRVVSPTTGIKIRRALSHYAHNENKDYSYFSSARCRLLQLPDASHYNSQELFVGWTPQRLPRLLVFIASQRLHLKPEPLAAHPHNTNKHNMLTELGNEALPLIIQASQEKVATDSPSSPYPHNYERFLLHRRLNIHNQLAAAAEAGDGAPVMPAVTGMSLRQGLQKLGKYKLTIRIEGSGRIMAQYPEAGSELGAIDACILILK